MLGFSQEWDQLLKVKQVPMNSSVVVVSSSRALVGGQYKIISKILSW